MQLISVFFCYLNRTIPFLPELENSSLQPYPAIAQPGLCGTWAETPKTSFLTTRLIYFMHGHHCVEVNQNRNAVFSFVLVAEWPPFGK